MILDVNNFLDNPGQTQARLVIRRPDGQILFKFKASSVTAPVWMDKSVMIKQVNGEKPYILYFDSTEASKEAVKLINQALGDVEKNQDFEDGSNAHIRKDFYSFRVEALNGKLTANRWYLVIDRGHGNYTLPAGEGAEYKCWIGDRFQRWAIFQEVSTSQFWRVNIREANAAILDGTFVHIQSTNTVRWEITHNLDKFPSVTVQSSDGTETFCPAITYINNDQIQLDFNTPVTGVAYLN